MSSREKQVVREVLAKMVDEAPHPVDFGDLADTRLESRPNPERRYPLIAALAGFVVVLAVVGGAIALTRPTGPVVGPVADAQSATIFLMPAAIPDDLELYAAEVWSEGNATAQTYLPPGESTYAEGDRVVNINVSDSITMAQEAGIDAAPDTLDASALFADLKETLETVYPQSQLSFNEITVRSKPALVVERHTTVGETPDTSIGVIVFEGNGIVTEVDTHQVQQDVVVAIAESLRPVTQEAFNAYATGPATSETAACRSTGSGEMSSEVDGIPWSLSISGQPPNVSMFAAIDQNPAGGMESDRASWPNHLRGEWEWIYVNGDIDVVSGKIPLHATARATLNDGTIMALCTVGSSLGHEVAYATGAFPKSTIIKTIEVIDANGATIGTMQLAELIKATSIESGDDGFTLGFAISTPTN